MDWNSAAATAVGIIDSKSDVALGTDQTTVKILRRLHGSIAATVRDVSNGSEDAIVMGWQIFGSIAMAVLKDKYGVTPKDVTNLLVKKQTDYGPANINEFGQFGLVVRTHDKVARLENLLAKGIHPSNEAVSDTYMDIVGYSAIGIMVERGWFDYQLV